MTEVLIFVSGVPWAEVGFWFSAFWTLIGVLVFIISFGSSNSAHILVGFAVLSVPVLLLSLFGYLAFGG